MGSHSRGDIPALTPAEAGTRLSDPGGMQVEFTWLACYIPRWYTRLNTVTHPGTNRARRALTSFMRRTTGQLQTGAYGIPSAERYGAFVPESTRAGIKPARPSPVTVVIHTTAARPAVPSVNSRLSLVFCCSLHLLEHSTQRHSICTISFFLSPAAKDIPFSSILP